MNCSFRPSVPATLENNSEPFIRYNMKRTSPGKTLTLRLPITEAATRVTP